MTHNRVNFSVREVGGSFLPVWPRYYDDSRVLLYMIDVSDHSKLSLSFVPLLDAISSRDMKDKPIFLIFNKTDLPMTMDRMDVSSVLRLDELRESLGPRFRIFYLSAFSEAGLGELLEAMVQLLSPGQPKKKSR
mmetsp:Transcript_18823/g.40873  ORF Transcript_18823/g.40873 Transcript_18823/m.40873 type:complete len:134 (-) Transcript_18823:106-507(-)